MLTIMTPFLRRFCCTATLMAGMTGMVAQASDVVGVTAVPNIGAYNAGQVVTIQVTFGAAVVVTGTPRLLLNTGAYANYVLGSGTSVLVFQYTVLAGNNTADLDYSSIAALDLNGGSIAIPLVGAADVTLPAPGALTSLGGSSALLIDTIDPLVDTIARVGSATLNGVVVQFSVTFTEPIQPLTIDGGDFQVNTSGGILGTPLVAVVGTGAGPYTVTVSAFTGEGMVGLTLVDNQSILDLAGNPLGGAGVQSVVGPTFTIDLTAPLSAPSAPVLSSGSDTGAFNNDGITGDTTPTFTGTGAEAASTVHLFASGAEVATATAAGDGSWMATSAALTDGTYLITATSVDGALNSSPISSASTLVIDTSLPTTPGIPATVGTISPANVIFTWAPATDIGGSGVVSYHLQVGTTSGGSEVFDGSVGAVLTAAVSGGDGQTLYGRVRASDAAGNVGPYSAPSIGVTVDAVPPGVLSINRALANPLVGSTASYLVVFSEPVSGVTTADFSLASTGLTGASITSVVQLTPATYSVSVNAGSGAGTLGLNLADDDSIIDLVGNALGGTGVGNGNSSGQLYAIDLLAPVVTGLAAVSADGAYRAGQDVTIAVQFTEPLTVDTNGGTTPPRLALDLGGGAVRYATYVSGSGSSTLAFTYTIQAADSTADLESTGSTALEANGALMTDASGNLAGLTLPLPGGSGSLAATSAIVIDTSLPIAPASLSGGSILTTNATVTFTWPAGVDVGAAGVNHYFVEIGTTPGSSNLFSGTTSGLSLSQVGTNGQTVYASVRTVDAAGNLSSAVSSAGVTIDTLAPTVVTIAPVVAGPTNASTMTTVVTFSEAVIGVDTGDFALVTSGLSGAAITSVTPTALGVYALTIATGSGSGSVRLDLTNDGSITDLAGNALAGVALNQSVTGVTTIIDRGTPTITVSAGAATSNATPIIFTMTTSEAVSGLNASALTIGNGTAGVVTAQSTTVFTVGVTPTGQGAVTCELAAGSITDAAGNSNLASNVVTVTYDSLAPTVVSLVNAGTSPNNTATATYTITLSEAVNGVDTADFTLVSSGLTGASITAVTPIGLGIYTLTVATGSGSGSLRLDLTNDGSITDLAGNALAGVALNQSVTGESVIIDQGVPTITVSAVGAASGVSPIVFTMTTSEAVTGLNASALTIGNGTAGVVTAQSTTVFTVAVTPTGQGAVTCQLAAGSVTDAAGNSNLASNMVTVTYDSLAPTTPGTPSDAGALTNLTAVAFAWTASADGGGGVTYELRVGTTAGGNEVFSGNVGAVLSTTVTGADGQTLYAQVRAIDSAGNASAFSSASDGIRIDTTTPTVPGVPTSPTTVTNNPAVTFSWTASSDSAGGVTYEVQIGTTPGGSDVFNGMAASNASTVTGVSGQTLYCRVRTVDAAGNVSAFTAASSGVLIDTTPPSAPGIPTTSALMSVNPTIIFAWNAATDAHSGVMTYRLQVGSTPGGSEVFDGEVGNLLSATVTGADGQTLYARVQAFDAAGNSGSFSSPSQGIRIDVNGSEPVVVNLPEHEVASGDPGTVSLGGFALASTGITSGLVYTLDQVGDGGLDFTGVTVDSATSEVRWTGVPVGLNGKQVWLRVLVHDPVTGSSDVVETLIMIRGATPGIG